MGMHMAQFLPSPAFDKILAIYEHAPELSGKALKTRPMTTSLQAFLAISGGERDLQAGEVLFCQDDPADSMYWIESGTLAILQGTLENPRLLGFRHPGQVVGEIALLEDIPRTASVAAIQPTSLKFLTKEKFQAILELIPGFGVELMRLLSARLREIQPAEYGAELYDHLTGALSRQAFDTRLQAEIKRARLYRYNFSLVFLDLDRFKEINDCFGHTRGDEVLVAFVQRVAAALRTTDLLFRYGGDEFVLILQGVDHARGRALIERLLDDSLTTPMPGDPPVHISFSAGIACYPVDGESPKELLQAADRRVYHAKDSGRGRVDTGQIGHP
jgi:diguanylate cyclase (GGDEF)-like protein